MKQNAFCPISDKQINERVTRLNAFFTVVMIVACCYSHNIYIAAFLASDFFIRAIDMGKYSPLSYLSTILVKLLPFKDHYINAGPKLFAARIGFTISILMVLSAMLNFNTVSYILFAILGLFSFLEFAMGICVACIIYPYVYKIIYGSEVPNNMNFKQYVISKEKF